MEWVASTLHTTTEHGVSSITNADAHTSAASSRLNRRPCRFKSTRPFHRKRQSGFCASAITFQTQSICSQCVVKHVPGFAGNAVCLQQTSVSNPCCHGSSVGFALRLERALQIAAYTERKCSFFSGVVTWTDTSTWPSDACRDKAGQTSVWMSGFMWCNLPRNGYSTGVPRGGVEFGVFKPPTPEIPKALQNRTKLNPTVKTVKNC